MRQLDERTQNDSPTTSAQAKLGASAFGAAVRKSGARARRSAQETSDLRLGWILAVCCAAQFMVILDLSIVNVALPHMQSALGFTNPELQWIVDAYSITFAGFLMLGGRAADHFGQRRMFVIALIAFALASLAGGSADSRDMLIGARAAQGLAGALMAACSLAIITSNFPAGPQRNRAIGLWAAMNGAGGAAGVLFGGIITQELSWRWVLLINPPIGAAAALVAYAVVRERRRQRSGESFDLAGALTLTVGQMVLVYGVVEAGLAGWSSAAALVPIALGLILLALFMVIEGRLASLPLIPIKQLTRPLRVANTIVLLFSASLFPMWFVSSLYLQQVLGLSPLDTGLVFLPMTLMIILSASRAGKLVSRYGVKPVLTGGLAMLTVGMLLLARIGPSGSAVVFVLLPGLLTGLGIGMSIVPSTIAATLGAREGQAGLASGLVNTSRQIGGGLGLALLVTLATQESTHLIGAGHGVPGALTDGFRVAFLLGGALAGAAALVTILGLARVRAAGTPDARRALLTFAAIIALFVAVDFAATSHGAPIGKYTKKGSYTFVSDPSLHPPKLITDRPTDTEALAPGYIFLASFYNLNDPPMIGQSGPLIVDSKLQPVWFQPVPEKVVASNLSLQSYEGKPALAWWQGVVTNTGATESGEDIVVNQHYQVIARLKGADGWVLTLHAFAISGQDAWVTANKNVPMDLARYGGAYNGALIDSAVQEYNLKTGKLVRSWDALKHIPLSDSYATLPTNGFPWDAYHVNAVEPIGKEDFLVSMRDTWAAYLVNARTGQIEWTLGGKHSSFKFGPGAEFQWQHDVVLHSNDLVSMFDDHCCQLTGGGTAVAPSAASRALELSLNMQSRTASVVAQFKHEPEIAVQYMGSTEPLADGNVFVGWGAEPYLTEYSPSGKLVLDAQFPEPDLSYRATLQPWVGLPLWPPKGAARVSSTGATVYASWNGATQVASWRVLAGANEAHPAVLASAAKAGFQTAIPVAGAHTDFKLQAIAANGRVLGTSRAFALG